MARKFTTVDYEEILDLQVSLRDVLPFDHLARFVVRVVAQLDLSSIYSQYSALGAPPYAPEILLALLFYGYATGVFSSRKIEKATYESIPFRFIAGNLHPDHDTIADFRKTFLPKIQELFAQILLLAQEEGKLELGNISLDGSKNPRRRFQEQSGKLQAPARTGGPTPPGSRRVAGTWQTGRPGRIAGGFGD